MDKASEMSREANATQEAGKAFEEDARPTEKRASALAKENRATPKKQDELAKKQEYVETELATAKAEPSTAAESYKKTPDFPRHPRSTGWANSSRCMVTLSSRSKVFNQTSRLSK